MGDLSTHFRAKGCSVVAVGELKIDARLPEGLERCGRRLGAGEGVREPQVLAEKAEPTHVG